MNRLLRRVILFEVGWTAGALVFGWCEIDGPWEVMLWAEKDILLPRHIGITQTTWNTCVVAMKCLPWVAGAVAFLLVYLLTKRSFKRWGLSHPAEGGAAGLVTTWYGRIADGGGLCVAALLFLFISGPGWTAAWNFGTGAYGFWGGGLILGWGGGSWPEGLHWLPRFGSGVLIPLWIPALIAALVTLFLLSLEQQQIREGHCPKCGYDLTGNVSGTCPECGTEIGEKTPKG